MTPRMIAIRLTDPPGAELGSQAPSTTSASVLALEPSAAGCDAVPGQREELPVSSWSRRRSAGMALSRSPPAGLVPKEKALATGAMRA